MSNTQPTITITDVQYDDMGDLVFYCEEEGWAALRDHDIISKAFATAIEAHPEFTGWEDPVDEDTYEGNPEVLGQFPESDDEEDEEEKEWKEKKVKEKEEKVKKEMEAKEFAKAFEKALNKRMKEMEDRHNETLKTLGTAIVDTIRINTPKKNKEATPLTPEGWDCSLNKSGDVQTLRSVGETGFGLMEDRYSFEVERYLSIALRQFILAAMGGSAPFIYLKVKVNKKTRQQTIKFRPYTKSKNAPRSFRKADEGDVSLWEKAEKEMMDAGWDGKKVIIGGGYVKLTASITCDEE